MSYKIAINGYGRIGRCVLRAFYESTNYADLRIVRSMILRTSVTLRISRATTARTAVFWARSNKVTMS